MTPSTELCFLVIFGKIHIENYREYHRQKSLKHNAVKDLKIKNN